MVPTGSQTTRHLDPSRTATTAPKMQSKAKDRITTRSASPHRTRYQGSSSNPPPRSSHKTPSRVRVAERRNRRQRRKGPPLSTQTQKKETKFLPTRSLVATTHRVQLDLTSQANLTLRVSGDPRVKTKKKKNPKFSSDGAGMRVSHLPLALRIRGPPKGYRIHIKLELHTIRSSLSTNQMPDCPHPSVLLPP
ncbi:hypothetical protein PWT90_11206 [Aphanocladium album]|nr:hypothetical protein PWT90_11206 [Aphanocladium album]